MSMPTLIRPAVPSDCDRIYYVHAHSVQYTCRTSYDENILQAWVKQLSPEAYSDVIKNPHFAFHVIEYHGKIQGFFQLDLKEATLDALYVHPFMHNRGLGTAMLQRAEQVAIEANLSVLRLYSSSNAIGFYKLNQFEQMGAATLPLDQHRNLPCQLMRKIL